MKNKVIYGSEARTLLKQGVDLVADGVKVTLGKQGLNVMCVRDILLPILTKDGVSVAKEISSNNPIIDAGASLVKQTANQTNEGAGDGCQDLNSKILTPSGFRRFGDLEIGDTICGTNGTFQTVEGIFPKGVKQLYKFTFADQRVTKACDNHMWSVITDEGRKKNLTTTDLINSCKVEKIVKDGSKKHGFYIPNTFVDFKEESALPLDPYLLGALLGDGSLSGTGAIELSLGKNKEHILNKLILPENTTYTKNWVESKNYFRVKFKMTESSIGGLSIVTQLKKLNLFGTTSHTKFVPTDYLYGSIETRNKLLKGLLDTDGYKNDRNLYSFTSVNRQLADNVLELFRGLGRPATLRTVIKKDKNSYSNNPMYEVSERKGYKHGIQLKSIEPTGEFVEVQCIKVSNEDSLYITEDYIVTHNTTTATVLAQAIVNEADKVLNKGVNAISLKRGLDLALDFSLKHLKTLSNNSSNLKTLKNIANVSTNGDEEISELVVEAFKKVGKNGTIKVEETDEAESKVDLSKGYELDVPFAVAEFINDREKFEAVFEDMNVLIYQGHLKDKRQLNKAIELSTSRDESGELGVFEGLLIICDNISGHVQKEILEFSYQGFKMMNLRSPSFGARKNETLKDIATLIGAKVYSEDLGDSLDDVTLEGLGHIDKVVADANKSVLIGGKGDETEIKERVQTVKEQIKNITGGKSETEFVKERYSKLTKGVAVIKVGGYSTPEKREKTDRVEDALCAVRACLEEGFVAGGGVTYLNISKALKSAKIETKNKDEQKGVEVLIKSLEYPFTQILKNAGIKYKNRFSIFGDKNNLINKVNRNEYGFGVDLQTNEFTNLLERGIIDPTKVERLALQNAVSISGTFLTLGAITYNSTPIFSQNGK